MRFGRRGTHRYEPIASTSAANLTGSANDSAPATDGITAGLVRPRSLYDSAKGADQGWWLGGTGLISNSTALAFGNGTWVVGTSSSATCASSTDGVNWTARTSNLNVGTTPSIAGITYANGVFLMVGGNTAGALVATSPDGITWTRQTDASIATVFGTSSINAVAYGGGVWVAVHTGAGGATSPDGITWTARTIGASANVTSVAYDGTQFVAVTTNGGLFTSPTGTTWTPQTSSFSSTAITTVGWSGTEWVAGGGSGKIASSTNGTAWTQRTSNFGASTVTSVAYGNGLWVAVGDSGKIATSPDGTTWTLRPSNIGGSNLADVAYGNAFWVASGVSAKTALSWSPTGPDVGRVLTFARANTESVAGSDAVSRALALPRAISDSAAATDTVTSTYTPFSTGITRSVADSAPATDSLARLLVESRGPPDTAGGSDVVTRTVVQARGIADAAGAVDACSTVSYTALQPVSTSVAGGWTPVVAATLESGVNDFDETDYDHATSLPSTMRLKLASSVTPPAGTRTLRMRVGNGSAGSVTYTLNLYEGGGDTLGAGVLRGTLTTQRTTTGFVTVEVPVIATITDYSALYVELTAATP